MEVESVGTFPVILLKLATPPLPPNIAGGSWRDDRMNPKSNKKLLLGAGSYINNIITWKGFFTQS